MGLAFIASLGLSLVGLTHYKPIKMVQKFIYGFGAGVLIFILWIIVVPPGMHNSFLNGFLLLESICPFRFVHSFSHIRICKKCVQTRSNNSKFLSKVILFVFPINSSPYKDQNLLNKGGSPLIL